MNYIFGSCDVPLVSPSSTITRIVVPDDEQQLEIMCGEEHVEVEWKRLFQLIRVFVDDNSAKIVYDECGALECSECGAVQPEDHTVYYCWNCGRKINE